MKFLEDLEWKAAFKRAAVFVSLWLVSLYVLSVVFPNYFGLNFNNGSGLITLIFYAVFFFFFFAVITAFSERSKRRRAAELRARRKGRPDPKKAKAEPGKDGDEAEPSLKGRHNPNTSRRKAARRRRR
jgi:hypothetical protein